MPDESIDERKELLTTLRAEYGYLFSDLHFFQGLRFAILGSTLPIAAGLFTYYRTALPFVKRIAHTPYSTTREDPGTAVMVAGLGVLIFLAVLSIELGIRHQTSALIARGAQIEETLGILNGAFTALKNRVRLWVFFRISGILATGLIFGIGYSVLLFGRALFRMFP